MNRKLFLLLHLFMVISAVSISQTKKMSCDYSNYADRHNDDEKRNALLDSACSEINKGNLHSAYRFLNEVARIDSSLTGEVNAFVDNQRERVLAYLETAAEEPEPIAKEEVKDPAGQPVAQQTEPAPVAKEEEKAPEVKEVEKPSEGSEKEMKLPGGKEPKTPKQPKQPKEPKQPKQPKEPKQPKQPKETVVEEKKPEPAKEVVEEKPQEPAKEVVEEKQPEPVPESASSSNPESTEIKAEAVPVPTEKENTEQAAPAATKSETPEKSFSEEEMAEFHSKGLQKVKQLEGFLQQVSSKGTNASLAQSAIDNALKLFDTEDRTVQVSSAKSPDKPKFKIRKYLDRLRLLNYENVDIEWADFQYTSDFILGGDGFYHGYIVFRQRFTATKDNRVAYEDITTKRTEVILKLYHKAVEGVETENWDVFLGDISVDQTETN